MYLIFPPNFSPLLGARGQAVPTVRRPLQHCGGGTRTGSLSAMPVASTTNYTTLVYICSSLQSSLTTLCTFVSAPGQFLIGPPI